MRYFFNNNRSNLYIDNKKYKIDTDIKIIKNINNNYIYKSIIFNNLNDKDKLINIISNELLYFFKKLKINKNSKIFIVGLGNINHTSDSVGPKVLNFVKVNSYLDSLGINVNPSVSALSPGVIVNTGIKTSKTIKNITKMINPDLVILIDSFVSNNINHLNKTIEINNCGLNPYSGIIGLNKKIDKNFLNTNILSIGVTTAIELIYDNNKYILSSNNIDEYVNLITEIIGISLNNVIYNLI